MRLRAQQTILCFCLALGSGELAPALAYEPLSRNEAEAQISKLNEMLESTTNKLRAHRSPSEDTGTADDITAQRPHDATSLARLEAEAQLAKLNAELLATTNKLRYSTEHVADEAPGDAAGLHASAATAPQPVPAQERLAPPSSAELKARANKIPPPTDWSGEQLPTRLMAADRASSADHSSPTNNSFVKNVSTKPVYVPMVSNTPGRLMGDGVQQDAVNLHMKSEMAGGVKTEFQAAQSMANSQADRLLRSQDTQLVRFKVAGDAGFMQYGTEYRSVGQNYRPQPGSGNYRLDQEGTESWMERRLTSWLSMKGMHSELTNNVALDPKRPRTTMNLTGAGTTLSIPSGPSLTVAYMTGTGETRKLDKPGQVQESNISQYSASLYYWHKLWDLSLSSIVVSSQDKTAANVQMQNVYHTVAATLRPTDRIWISPSVSYGDDRYKWNGERVTTPMMSLSMYWQSLFNLVDFNSYTLFMNMKSNAGYMNATTLYSLNSFIYQLEPIRNRRYLSLDIVHNGYRDHIYSQYSIQDTMVRLMYTTMAL